MNPAQRLLELIDFFTTTATDKSMEEVWARYINAEAPTAIASRSNHSKRICARRLAMGIVGTAGTQ